MIHYSNIAEHFTVTLRYTWNIKGPLSGLRRFLAAENSLKMMKNAFYLMLKVLFDLKIFKFMSRLFFHVEKRLDKKAKVNFKNFDATDWETNNYNPHIA